MTTELTGIACVTDVHCSLEYGRDVSIDIRIRVPLLLISFLLTLLKAKDRFLCRVAIRPSTT